MILRFPSQEVLLLSLTSHIVDAKTQCAPAKFCIGPDQDVWIEAGQKISRNTLSELKKLGVQSKRSVPAEMVDAISWHQAISLVSKSDRDGNVEGAEVLFELGQEADLPSVVGEMMRLGNDRQSFRYIVDDGVPKTLLRVVSPPYYTLLRATSGFS
ncbi:MAG: hypothetical protein ACR2NZ_04010, partial [Rubripirellula sp.]